MHLTGSETQLLSEPLLMREEIVLGLFRLSSLMEHKLNLVLSIKQLNAQHFSNLDAHSMKPRRPTMFATSLCILLMLLLTACIGSTSTSGSTPTASATVTLTYWYTEATSETPVILGQIQAFEQQNPNIKINAQYIPYGEAQARFATAAQAGKAPDVLRSDVGWTTQFASLRYLLPIDQYVSKSDLSDYLPSALNYDKYNGHL